MKILITGACGFIGFHTSLKLLKNNKITGIDNINNYYSTKLKRKRLSILLNNKNFTFKKLDIRNKNSFKSLSKDFDIIIHLAAQAGVRYSILKPREYLENNIVGFFNILEFARTLKTKLVIYASSSSVYGENNNFPINEKNILKPKNIYALSKENNEHMAEIYANFYNLNLIGLRFFTIFGEWGRPDMLIMKFLTSLFSKKEFKLNNNGNHHRDFTYIQDVVEIIEILIKNKKKVSHKIFNICSNSPIKITKIIDTIQKKIKKKANIKYAPFQRADILKTHGDNKNIKKFTKFKKFTVFDKAITNTVRFFEKNKSWYLN